MVVNTVVPYLYTFLVGGIPPPWHHHPYPTGISFKILEQEKYKNWSIPFIYD